MMSAERSDYIRAMFKGMRFTDQTKALAMAGMWGLEAMDEIDGMRAEIVRLLKSMWCPSCGWPAEDFSGAVAHWDEHHS